MDGKQVIIMLTQPQLGLSLAIGILSMPHFNIFSYRVTKVGPSDILKGRIEYSDIFHEDITKQIIILRIFRNLWKKRNTMN